MKTFILLSSLAAVVPGWLLPAPAQTDYTVHEWGTFTSVSGGDGKLLAWQPLRSSELPGFVHNWTQPGLNRQPLGPAVFRKVTLMTLQRMETPVIYFYSDRDMTADVSVGFPKGTITEWYPQATQIGPSVSLNTNESSAATLAESRATWKNLHLTPPSKIQGGLPDLLPQAKSSSHYFAARATGSDLVQTDLPGQGSDAAERDKFIFYRGAGSFPTPLRVRVDTNDAVTVENNGAEPLAHLFLISVRDNGRGKTAAFTALENLSPHDSVPGQRLPLADFQPLENFQAGIGARMQAALVAEGLFADEARAMVNTWKDSWFAETGDRVLYVLPRAWTDETLPMTLNPQPARLVRVMVGRAEIITPQTEINLSQTLARAADGDLAMRQTATQEIRTLGRFALPALELVNAHASSTNAVNLSYRLLSETEARPSPFE